MFMEGVEEMLSCQTVENRVYMMQCWLIDMIVAARTLKPTMK